MNLSFTLKMLHRYNFGKRGKLNRKTLSQRLIPLAVKELLIIEKNTVALLWHRSLLYTPLVKRNYRHNSFYFH